MHKEYWWALYLYAAWALGIFVAIDKLSRDYFQLYLSLPISGPLGLMVVLWLLLQLVKMWEAIPGLLHRTPRQH